MKKYSILLFALALTATHYGQQDAQVSLYLRNPTQYNPAHAGLDGTLRTTAISRMQWTGWEGAPRTQFFTAHAPAFRNRVGAGLAVMNDASGARSQREFMFQGAYHLPELTGGIHISAGLSIGLETAGYDFQNLQAYDLDDPAAIQPFNQTRFASGFGLLAHAESWYVSFAVPQLLENDLGATAPIGRSLRHLYTSAGYVHPLSSFVELRGAMLVKAVSGAPAVIDFNAECWLYDVLSVGAMARIGEGVGLQASYRFKDGFRFHYAVDFPTNGLMMRSFGSHEIGLAWDYGKRPVAYKSPRHF